MHRYYLEEQCGELYVTKRSAFPLCHLSSNNKIESVDNGFDIPLYEYIRITNNNLGE